MARQTAEMTDTSGRGSDGLVMDRSHGRPPRQSRSRATLERITAAAEGLFAEHGYDGTTVSDIVSRARCSVGAFYARFNDKEALLLHIHDAHCRSLIERVGFLCDLLHAENATLETVVRQTVRAFFRFAADRRALTRVFIQRGCIDPAFHLRYARAWAEVRTLLRPLFLSRRREIVRPNPERAVDFVLQLVHSGWFNDALHSDVSGITGQSTNDPLIEDLSLACLSYLGTGRTERP
jgi:AcrR family transcriptional regulator